MFTDMRVKLRSFIKKHKWTVILVIIIWLILMVVNFFLTHQELSDEPQTSYTPYKPVVENGETMPSKWENTVEETIAEYIGYCNQKEYEKAYSMISEEAKKEVYPTLESFQAYVDYVFAYPRVYTIQNYANHDDVYIYRIRLFEDILATGMTYSENLLYFEEKVVFQEKEGKLYLSLQSYIGDETLDDVYQDQYMKISVINRSVRAEEVVYTITLQNKTEYTIVLADSLLAEEIDLITSKETIPLDVEKKGQPIIAGPHTTIGYSLTFPLFYDEGAQATGIGFNHIRVLRSYTGDAATKEAELEDAIAIFSITVPIHEK